MPTQRRIAAIASLAIAAAACLESGPTSPRYTNPAAGRTVLFIGNSLTYVNDVPALVQGIADAAGGDSLIIAAVAGPDMALIDHWRRGDARAAIDSRKWDYVVLQQGPSSTTINRDSLRLVARLYEPSITAAGAKAVLFSAWPSAGRRQDFPRAAESYRLAAADVNGLYAPVADAWVELWNRDATLDLYSDGLHANALGSYLAALTIYARIFAKSPVGLPATFRLRGGGSVSFPADITAKAQEAAWAAVLPTLPP
ncbi:MAG TPA: SGNH/GDSL hydrolase family protein [Gemmatimonadaceae bacterium]|nr:SGNH/GDSL hydrolase family protein [Gemmatimonadaceae bacterium]